MILLIAITALVTGCNGDKKQTMNPFLSDYDTPFGVPPFHLIETGHFIPAFQAGIRQQETELDAIIRQSAAPTFENTIAAFDASGEILRKVGGVFYRLRSAETNDEIDSIAKILVPITSAHQSNIMLNPELFARVKSVYDNRDQMDLTTEQSRVLEKIYLSFVRGGANLDETGKERIREIDEKLSMLSLQFGDNLLKETNAYELVIENEAELKGLPESVRSAAAETAAKAGYEGRWMFTLHSPSWIPFLQYAGNRDLREELYRAMFMRGNNGNEYDNKEIVAELLALRIERARPAGI